MLYNIPISWRCFTYGEPARQIDVHPIYALRELKHQHHDAGVETIVIHAPATPTLTQVLAPSGTLHL
jgi:hypothetical protein